MGAILRPYSTAYMSHTLVRKQCFIPLQRASSAEGTMDNRLIDSLDAAIERGRTDLDARMQALAGKLAYAETAYALPVAYAVTGIAVRDADGAREAYGQSATISSSPANA